MSKLNKLNALAASVVVSALGVTVAHAAAANPFAATDLAGGYQQLADNHAEGKCGEGKCGEGKRADAKDAEGKCGEGKCGEGKCGGEKSDGTADGKKKEGKCGEGKCGEMK